MKINFIYAPDVSFEQMIGYEIASIMWGQLFTDDIEVNILAKNTDELNSNVIGGAIPEFHEQHYGLFLQYYEADITSEEDQIAFDALQQGNTIDFLLDGDLVGGNTKIKLTTALAKALGMNEAISLDRYVLDESQHLFDGTIMMNRDFAWDFNYLRNSEAAENTLDFMSVALHETGHILGFTSSLDFSLEQETLFSGRTELSNFSPLDLFRFSAESLTQNNPDGAVNDLSIGGVAWFSPDGGETISANMSTGKDGDGFQASHWERRYDPLGIMDPTLWYQERASITDLDVLAFDLMGYDLSSGAQDVEELFESENLEVILAQAKVQLAHKLGYSVQYIEDNADVPVSSLDLIAEMEAAMLEAAQGNTSNTTFNGTSNPGDVTEPQNDFTEGVSTMTQNAYNWWSQGNGGGNSWWQNLYEWWSQGNGGGNSSWQELYEWWWQNNGGGNSSWQELYEWWSQGNGGGNSAWAQLYEWWMQDNGGGNSWWQEVSHASQDETTLENIELPGESNDTTVGAAYYKTIKGENEDDIIGGDISDDDIDGKKGDDLIDGAEGNDTILGGDGYDTIFGFDGQDSIMGGDGDDVISGESDKDVLLGEAGSDVLMGGDHDDYLDGGTGRDFLNGNTGHDVLNGGAGDDALEGEAGKDLLIGGSGLDIGNGGSGDDFIFGDEYSESFKQAIGDNASALVDLFTPTTEEDTSVVDDSAVDKLVDFGLNQTPQKIEAEDMTLSGNYTVTSGGLVQTNSSSAQLSTVFNGEAGLYEIVIGYHDVSGDAKITASLGSGGQLDSWLLNQNSSSSSPSASNFNTRTIASEVMLNGGESLVLDTVVYAASSGDDDDDGGGVVNDKAYIDYVEFVPIVDNTIEVVLDPDPKTTDPKTTEPNTTDTSDTLPAIELGAGSDILRGGNGNDGIDGGKGNDVIFGEDELNDSSNISSPGIKDAIHNEDSHSSYILTQKATTWEEAQKEAQSYGGNLVTINDAAEEQWLKDTFGTDQTFHIGLTRTEQWISGEKLTYKTSDFNSVETQNVLLDSSGTKILTTDTKTLTTYTRTLTTDTKTLTTDTRTLTTDTTNQDEKFGIIEIDWSSVGGNDTIFGGAGDDRIYGNSGNDLLYGDDLIGNQIIVQTPTTMTFQQGVNGYNGTVDTFLQSSSTNANNSSDTSLIVDSSSANHSLIRFENIFGSQASQIALGSTINSAILEIDVFDAGNSFTVHELLTNWADSSTWNSWGSGIQANGVEAASTPVATTNWVNTGILQIDVTASLQAWIANPSANMGWAFLPTGSDGVDFYSAEGSNAPRLVVDYLYNETQSTPTEGNDNITGNGGHDVIHGGAGDDIINGTDQIVAGYLERDVLNGGDGADTFVLGDKTQAFYATGGTQDYAVIQDFRYGLDNLQLHGSAADYQSVQQGNDVHLTRNNDLVAILENNSTLDMKIGGFEYLGTV